MRMLLRENSDLMARQMYNMVTQKATLIHVHTETAEKLDCQPYCQTYYTSQTFYRPIFF